MIVCLLLLKVVFGDIRRDGSGFSLQKKEKKKKKNGDGGLLTFLIIKMIQNKSICFGRTKPKINILVGL